ncbi:left-right determination factor 2-like [Ptychodera flava]|uniref:left-right determination factor 2-like n=1 Tax=Ptychodera flava TaxID=63121 RepID=UPI003969E785
MKYWALTMKHRHRSKREKFTLPTFARVIRENEAFLADVVYAGSRYHRLQFEMTSGITKDSKIAMAEFKLYKRKPNHTIFKPHNSSHPVRHARVSIHQVIQSHANGTANSSILIDSGLVAIDDSGWKTFDITSAVERWMVNIKQPFVLEVRINGARPTVHATRLAQKVEFSTNHLDSGHTPQVNVYTEHFEQRFGPSECEEGKEHETCCRKSKYVNFRDTQWTNRWIIEPSGYDAFECVGPCHITKHSEPTDLVACGVEKSSPLPMMYLTKNGDVTELMVSEIPNMIIDECKCRA